MIEHHVPCHVPSFKTIFVKHSSVVDLLCNTSLKSAIESWSLGQPPRCCCTQWSRYRSAALNSTSDHWVLSGSLLTHLLPADVAVLAEGSLQNKVFPQKREFLSLLQRGIRQWCKFNGLPSIPKPMVQDLASTLWSSHLSQLTNHITPPQSANWNNFFLALCFIVKISTPRLFASSARAYTIRPLKNLPGPGGFCSSSPRTSIHHLIVG